MRDKRNIITWMQAVKWCRSIADVLNYLADKRIVHRDIAARNIMLDQKKSLKLIDFGLAVTAKTAEADFYDEEPSVATS